MLSLVMFHFWLTPYEAPIVGPLISYSLNVNIFHNGMRCLSGELLLADMTDKSRLMLYPMTWLSLVGPLNTSLERKLNSQRDEMLNQRITIGRDGR